MSGGVPSLRHVYIIMYLFTAIGLLPGGNGYFTCKQNTKLVTTRFKSGGLHEKHVVAFLRDVTSVNKWLIAADVGT